MERRGGRERDRRRIREVESEMETDREGDRMKKREIGEDRDVISLG
jgi:hypothetical protein